MPFDINDNDGDADDNTIKRIKNRTKGFFCTAEFALVLLFGFQYLTTTHFQLFV